MKTQFASLVEFMDYFESEESCANYFSHLRFRDGEYCVRCGHDIVYPMSGQKMRCAKCKKDSTLKTNTIFKSSKVSLRQWFIAIYLLATSSSGISSIEFSEKVGVSQKTALSMDKRIREVVQSIHLPGVAGKLPTTVRNLGDAA